MTNQDTSSSDDPSSTSLPDPGTLPTDQTQRIRTVPPETQELPRKGTGPLSFPAAIIPAAIIEFSTNVANALALFGRPEATPETAVPPEITERKDVVLPAQTSKQFTTPAVTEPVTTEHATPVAMQESWRGSPPAFLRSPDPPPSVPVEPPVPLRVQPRTWEDHEPTDPLFPVSHLHVADLDGTREWRIAGASRRGKMHAHESKYREDAWQAKVSHEDMWCIIAVADGGGSYELARVGSHIAVDAAVESLLKNLPEREFKDPYIRAAMSMALSDAYRALEQRAASIAANERPHTTSRDLSTTLLLLAFCSRQRKLAVAQVGDGLIALQKADKTYVKLMDGDAGEVAGATVFLNNVKSLQWDSRIQLYNLNEVPHFLVVMTDGVADDVLESEQQNTRTLFDALRHYTQEKSPAQAICTWLGYDKRGSFDDRTLVVIYPT